MSNVTNSSRPGCINFIPSIDPDEVSKEEFYPPFAPKIAMYYNPIGSVSEGGVPVADNVPVRENISCVYYPLHLVSSFFLSLGEASFATISNARRTYTAMIGQFNPASIRAIFLAYFIFVRTVLWVGSALYSTFSRSVQLFSQKMGWTSPRMVDVPNLEEFATLGMSGMDAILVLDQEQREHPLRNYAGDGTPLRLSHIRTNQLELDDTHVPNTVTIESLRGIFNEINFRNPNADLYISPVDRTEGVDSVEGARNRLELYITMLAENMSNVSHVPMAQRASLARAVKTQVRLSIHKSNEDLRVLREANGVDPATYLPDVKAEYLQIMTKRHQMVMALLLATTHCGGRYKSSATMVYDSIYGIDTNLNMKDTLIEGLAVKRKGLLDEIMQPYVSAHRHDANARNAYQTALCPLLGIPDFGGYPDPIAQMGSGSLPTVEAAMREFFGRYTLAFVYQSVNELFNDSSIFRQKLLEWIEEKMGDWAQQVFSQKKEIYLNRIRSVIESSNEQYNIENNQKQLDKFLAFVKEIRPVMGSLPIPSNYQSWDNFLEKIFEPQDSIIGALVVPGLVSQEKMKLMYLMNMLKILETIDTHPVDLEDIFSPAVSRPDDLEDIFSSPVSRAESPVDRAKKAIRTQIIPLLNKTNSFRDNEKFLTGFLSGEELAETYLNRQLMTIASSLIISVKEQICRDPSLLLEEPMLSDWLKIGASQPQVILDKCSNIYTSPIFQGIEGVAGAEYRAFLLGDQDVTPQSQLINTVTEQIRANVDTIRTRLRRYIPQLSSEPEKKFGQIIKGEKTISDYVGVPSDEIAEDLRDAYEAADNIRQILSCPDGCQIYGLPEIIQDLCRPGFLIGQSNIRLPREVLVVLLNSKRSMIQEVKENILPLGMNLSGGWSFLMQLYSPEKLNAFLDFSERMESSQDFVKNIQQLLQLFQDRPIAMSEERSLGRVQLFKEFMVSGLTVQEFFRQDLDRTARTRVLEKFKFNLMKEILPKNPGKDWRIVMSEVHQRILSIRRDTVAYKPRNGDVLGDELLSPKEVEALIRFARGDESESKVKSLIENRFCILAKINKIINGELKEGDEEGYEHEPIRVGRATLLDIFKKDRSKPSYQRDLEDAVGSFCERARKEKFRELFKPNPKEDGANNTLSNMLEKPIRQEGQPEVRMNLSPAVLEWLLVDTGILFPQILHDRSV